MNNNGGIPPDTLLNGENLMFKKFDQDMSPHKLTSGGLYIQKGDKKNDIPENILFDIENGIFTVKKETNSARVGIGDGFSNKDKEPESILHLRGSQDDTKLLIESNASSHIIFRQGNNDETKAGELCFDGERFKFISEGKNYLNLEEDFFEITGTGKDEGAGIKIKTAQGREASLIFIDSTNQERLKIYLDDSSKDAVFRLTSPTDFKIENEEKKIILSAPKNDIDLVVNEEMGVNVKNGYLSVDKHIVADKATLVFENGVGLNFKNEGTGDFIIGIAKIGEHETTRWIVYNNGGAFFNGNVGIRTQNPAGCLQIKSPWADWIFLEQERSTEGGGGFHIHNPWGDDHEPERNRLEIGYRTSLGEEKWGQFVIHGPTGNVGVGTANPSHKFHVLAQDAVGLFESTGDQAYLRLSTKDGLDNRVEITNRPLGRLSLWTSGAGDVFNITRDGKVGIGITSPGTKLHTVADYVRFEGTNPSAPNCPEIQIGEVGSKSYWVINKRGSNASPESNQLLFHYYDGSNWINNMNLKPDKDVIFNGNVGIGKLNPTHKFHVLAQDAVGLFESTGEQAYLRLSTNEGIENRVEITNRLGGRLSLWTAGGGDVLNITRDGNVGIGTINPQGKLTVTQGGQNAGGIVLNKSDREWKIGLFSNLGTGGYNPIVSEGNTGIIFSNGLINSDTDLVIAPWSDKIGGIKITSDGKVGIGTTSPGTKLHTVADYIRFEGTNPDAPNCPEIQIREANSHSYWIINKRGSKWDNERDQLIFSYTPDDGTNWFQNINLKPNKDVIFNGNVGIGTTDFTKGKLVVNGRLAVNPTQLTSYPSNWGEGIHTWDVYAEGTVGTGQNGQLNAWMNHEGHASFAGNVNVQGNLAVSGGISGTITGAVPVGTIIASGSDSTPDGYLYCDGREIDKNEYNSLWQCIGNKFGSAGSGKFKLPDLRGMFLRGVNDNRNDDFKDPDVNNRENNGEGKKDAIGSYQYDQYGEHSHSMIWDETITGTRRGVELGDTDDNSGFQTKTNGGKETRAKNVYVKYYIKF